MVTLLRKVIQWYRHLQVDKILKRTGTQWRPLTQRELSSVRAFFSRQSKGVSDGDTWN